MLETLSGVLGLDEEGGAEGEAPAPVERPTIEGTTQSNPVETVEERA